MRADKWHKWQGHVLAPLIGTMRGEGMSIPDHFNAKSRCTPSWKKVQEELEDDFGKLDEKLKKLTPEAQEERTERKLGDRLDWPKVRRAYVKMLADADGGVSEDAALELREKLRGFAVLPIDKYNAEMAIV